MIVDTRVYVLSMITVLIGFIIRDFIIPLFVWRRHLKGRGFAYTFWFCVLTQAFIQINLVTILGILNILNRFTFIGLNLIIYGLIIWNFSDKKIFVKGKNTINTLWNSYKNEWLAGYLSQSIKKRLKIFNRKVLNLSLWKNLKKNWLECLLLTGFIIYNIWFMTHNVMTYHCFQFSDIPVHQSWVYELEQGNLYSSGIYPFGMHIMIYFVRAVFRINLREIMLYAGAYQFVILIIGIYLLAKEIFVGKYIPMAVILIVSFMVNQGRFAASLPQEAGIYAVVAIIYFMIRYLHKDREKHILEGDSKLRSFFRINSYVNRRYIDSEMLLLMISVTLVIFYHYYSAIAAIFAIIAIGLAYLPRIFKKQNFVPLLFSGIVGALIAVVPIGICLAKGIPFQESMDWAKSLLNKEEWHGSDADYQKNLAMALGDDTFDKAGTNDGQANDSSKSIYSGMTFKDIIKYYFKSLYNFGSSIVMFGAKATNLMFACMLIGLICALLMFLSRKNRVFGYDYVALIIMMILFFTTGAFRDLGVPEFIASARAPSFAQPFIGLIYMLPVDYLFRVLKFWKNRSYQMVLRFLSLVVCIVVAFYIINAGWYHNFFDVNLAYYNEVEYVLRNIRKSYKKYSYTIVSPTDEYYDVVDHGRHTELSEFVNMINKKDDKFTFTTDYVFFFIEKLVLHDYNYGRVRVSPEYALKDFVYMEDYQDYNFQRAVIESKAYYWAKKFQEMYPRNFKVFFENDIYVVYLMEQNTYYPYDLQIDYLKDLRELTYGLGN